MIEKGPFYIRPLQETDIPYMTKWLSDPEVLEWYEGRDQAHDAERVKQHFFSGADERVNRNLILLEDTPIGYVQYYPLSEKEKRLYGYIDEEPIFGMDQFIGELKYQNKGIGSSFILLIVDFLFEEWGAKKVVMDPRKRNERALRCYEKCGFRRVKELKAHEKHEGKWEDCILMEKTRIINL
ncbi:GNAT family N-acetyltransferase [Pseudalkalibacillus sp. SCS-8]|uniref:GNAT family N-acetyltransferase n=1 Tax=Pseudalkalibacillus nanhaiensis TaxID=3115291 RepID=UPI0032DA8E75